MSGCSILSLIAHYHSAARGPTSLLTKRRNKITNQTQFSAPNRHNLHEKSLSFAHIYRTNDQQREIQRTMPVGKKHPTLFVRLVARHRLRRKQLGSIISWKQRHDRSHHAFIHTCSWSSYHAPIQPNDGNMVQSGNKKREVLQRTLSQAGDMQPLLEQVVAIQDFSM